MNRLTRDRWMRKHLAQTDGAQPVAHRRRTRHYSVNDRGCQRNPDSYCRPWTTHRNHEIATAVKDPE